MRKIILCGELGKRFGRVHRLDVKTPAESIRALCATIKGFKKFVETSNDRKVGYKAIKGKEELEVKQFKDPMAKQEVFKIVPVFTGSGAVGRIIAGAIMIAAGALLSITPLAAVSPYLQNAGFALIVGGAAQMLSGNKKVDVKEGEQKPQSTSFNGPINTTAQGHAVPILYGRMIVGSHVISAKIETQGFRI